MLESFTRPGGSLWVLLAGMLAGGAASLLWGPVFLWAVGAVGIVGYLAVRFLSLPAPSPRAVQSTYVNNEIRYFKKIGREDRVLAVMVEGEPNASRDPGKQAMGFRVQEECFPEALRHKFGLDGAKLDELTEPVAADFRLGKEQGWTSPEAYRQAMRREDVLSAREIERRVEDYRERSHLMLLKILAGILGVPLGRLTRRDKAYQLAKAQQRARIARRIAAGFALLAVAAIAAAVVAVLQYRGGRKVQTRSAGGRRPRHPRAARSRKAGRIHGLRPPRQTGPDWPARSAR